MNKFLTATEIEKNLEPFREWVNGMQKAFLLPLIEKTKEILHKRGIEIPKAAQVKIDLMEEDHKRALIMAPFADYLASYSEEFNINDIPDERRIVFVEIERFKEVYKLGCEYCMGIRINWVTG